MDDEDAGELRELVQYERDTAGGLMTTDYMWIYPHRTVAATIAKIREIAPETEFIYYLYVTDASREAARRALAAHAAARAADGIHPQAHGSRRRERPPDVSAEEVASTIARYDLLGRPVVDDEQPMLGIVTVDDAIDAIIPEKIAQSLPRFTRHRKKRRLLPAAKSSAKPSSDRARALVALLRAALLFAGVLGPGFITASAGNDVGGIATYSRPARKFGYSMLWTLVPLTIALDRRARDGRRAWVRCRAKACPR